MLDQRNINAAPTIYIRLRDSLLRGAALLVLCMGLAIHGEAGAQPFQTTLPHLFNEAAGTGSPGSEIAGRAATGEEVPRPAIASAIPTAYGTDFGDVFSGVAYQRYLGPSIPERNDGAAFVGVGMGDAQNTVGLEISYANYALVEEPFSDGSLSLKLHRQLYKGLAVGVGIENAIAFGDWASQSAYVVASHTVPVDNRLLTGASATIGVGNGRFNTMARLSERTNKASLFGGLSAEIMDFANVFSTWHGQDLNLGLSFIVRSPIAVTVTPVWVNVLNKHVSGDRFALSVGTRYRFR